MYNMPRQYPFMFNPQMYNMLPYMFWYAPQMMYPPMFPNMPISVSYTHLDVYKRQLLLI